MELNGKVLSIHLQTKEQYEEGEWRGMVVSMFLEGHDPYIWTHPDEWEGLSREEILEKIKDDNAPDVLAKLVNECAQPGIARLLDALDEKERKAT